MLQIIPEWLMYIQIMVIIFFQEAAWCLQKYTAHVDGKLYSRFCSPCSFVELTGAIYRLISVSEVRNSVLKWMWSWPSLSFYIVGDTGKEDLVFACTRAMPGAAEDIVRTPRILTATISGLAKASRSLWIVLLMINMCQAVCQPLHKHYFI